MPEENGTDIMSKHAERIIKVRIPLESDEDPLEIFEEMRKKHGKKMTMDDIERLLAGRFGG